jgi:hypothetical protein
MTWTRFHDMHSGGVKKESFSNIYIEAPEEEAARVFFNRYGHNPYRVTCTCCGPDYCSIEFDTLEEAQGPGWSIEDGVVGVVIRADEIQPDERSGHLPQQGYVWHE